jgi:hypothetical protein
MQLAKESIMATKERNTKGRRLAASAKALNVDPEWLRTGEGSPLRKLAATPQAEVIAIYRRLQPYARDAWLDAGRAFVAIAGDRNVK